MCCQVELEVNGQRLIYKVLVVLEFNSDRKRLSVVCRCVWVFGGGGGWWGV